MPKPPILQLLRGTTNDAHIRLETTLDLRAGATDQRRIAEVVDLLGSFWTGSADVIDDWANECPEPAARLRWQRRRPGDRRLRDLSLLGARPVHRPAAPAFADVDLAAVLGWLYVHEGSSLGGTVLQRRLVGALGGLVLETFVPYTEGPAAMWRSYLRALDHFVQLDAAAPERICAAAASTFVALERHIAVMSSSEAA